MNVTVASTTYTVATERDIWRLLSALRALQDLRKAA
jgi:hypothetical protein